MIFYSITLAKKLLSPSGEVSFVFFEVDWDFLFKEWQFVMLEAEFLGKKVKKPYSIATSYDYFRQTRQIWFIVKRASEDWMSYFLTHLVNNGDKAKISTPVWHFTDKKLSINYFFISTGSWLSPIYSHLSHLLESWHTGKIVNLYGERYAEHLLSETEKIFSLTTPHFKNFLHLSQEKNLPANRKPWRIQESFNEAIDWLGENFVVYICGKPEMVDNIREKLKEKNHPKEMIFFEKY